MLPSINSYDWLGNGIYFWENSFSRAQEWAESYCERDHKKHPDKEKKKPAVIGAVIALGHCLNLTDYGSASILKNAYDILSYELFLQGKDLPINKNVGENSDLLLRELDCAVIQRIHQYNKELQKKSYDSVRVSDGKLTETKKADYFSTLCRIDCAAFYKKAYSSRKYGTLPSELTGSGNHKNI